MYVGMRGFFIGLTLREINFIPVNKNKNQKITGGKKGGRIINFKVSKKMDFYLEEIYEK